MSELVYKYSSFLIYPLIALVVALLLTRVLIDLLPKVGLVDKPGGRHIHENVTPKGGGLAIVVAFFASLFLLLKFGPTSLLEGDVDCAFFHKILYPAVVLWIVGILDDRFDIPAKVKLLGQITVGVLCWYAGIKFSSLFAIPLPTWLSIIITVGWIVAFINAFNLVDGMDGLASGLSVVSSICMAVVFIYMHRYINAVAMLCLTGACLGFLRFNFHPAKVFMGDSGSMFLGYMFAVVGLTSASKTATISAILVPVLAAGVPFFDVVLAIWRRTSRKIVNQQKGAACKGGIMTADAEHLHHRLFEKSKNQRKTVLAIYGIAVAFSVLSLLLIVIKDSAQGVALALILVAMVVIIRRIANIELWNSSEALAGGLSKPSKRLLISIVHPFFDLAVLSCSFLLIYWLFVDLTDSITGIKEVDFLFKEWTWYTRLLYNITPCFVLLLFSRAYKRSWFHACSHDYFSLIQALVIGFLIGICIDFIGGINDLKLYIASKGMFMMLAGGIIMGERMFIRFIRSSIHRQRLQNTHGSILYEKILVYGTGENCQLYLHEIKRMSASHVREVVALVSDDFNRVGKILYGYRVVGMVNELEQLHSKVSFNKMVIAKDQVSSENRKVVVEFCKDNDIELTEWKAFEERIS